MKAQTERKQTEQKEQEMISLQTHFTELRESNNRIKKLIGQFLAKLKPLSTHSVIDREVPSV